MQDIRLSQSLRTTGANTWVSWLSATKATSVSANKLTAHFPPKRGDTSRLVLIYVSSRDAEIDRGFHLPSVDSLGNRPQLA